VIQRARYVVRTISPRWRAPTKHSPRWPSCRRQCRGQTSHCVGPSSVRCQHRVRTAASLSRVSDAVLRPTMGLGRAVVSVLRVPPSFLS
jgi:hypothetical protein